METSSSSGSSCSSTPRPCPEPWKALDSGEIAWANFTAHERESIARHYAPKVKYLALRLKSRLPKSVELNELISAGTLGLMEAFGKFRPDLAIKFDTYAESRIRGAMLDELRRLDWFPRSLRRKVRTLDEAIHKLEHEHGRIPSEEELAEETGFELPVIRQTLEALQNQFFLSLDVATDNLTPADTSRDGAPHQQIEGQELIDKVAELITQLTEREKLVLSLYYTDELNMRETAEVMGITEGRVSQLHSQALSRLRREFLSRHGQLEIN